jgi:hypothetical protein
MGGETLLKKLEVSATERQQVGRLVERAIEVAQLNHKQASLLMGLSDDGVQVSRWCAGTEPPSLARMNRVPALALGYAVALCELHQANVQTVVTIPMARAR